MGKPDPRRGYIIVGLQTQEATSLMKYSCSERVIPVPTSYLNARRCSNALSSACMALNFVLKDFLTIIPIKFGVVQDITKHPVPCADICVPDAAQFSITRPGLPHVFPVHSGERLQDLSRQIVEVCKARCFF